VVFGKRCFEANHWRKKTALAANSGGRDLLDGLPVCGTNTAEVQGTGEWKLHFLQSYRTDRFPICRLMRAAHRAALESMAGIHLKLSYGIAAQIDHSGGTLHESKTQQTQTAWRTIGSIPACPQVAIRTT
jgi:hypothetical protein